jgi:2-methylcitrate dehydratase PrpD
MGKLLSATLIAATLALVAPAYAQVRVITRDTEHVYGPGGQLLDDAELRAKNERIERARQIEKQRRQEEADAESQRSKTGYDQVNEQLERSRPKRGSKTAE